MPSRTTGKLSGRELFFARLRSSGRWPEFRSVVDRIRASEGLRWSPANYKAMRQFGYLGPDGERALHLKDRDRELEDEMREEIEEDRRVSAEPSLEDAMVGLPNRVDSDTEWSWIGSHPKMAGRDDGEEVFLVASDVLEPPNGMAPSRSAVLGLQHWVNNKSEFFKHLVQLDKKRATPKASDDERVVHEEAEADEIEAMLREFRS